MTSIEPTFKGEKYLSEHEPNIYVSLTYDLLDATAQMARVKSPKAGAVVLFAGTSSSPGSKIITLLFDPQ